MTQATVFLVLLGYITFVYAAPGTVTAAASLPSSTSASSVKLHTLARQSGKLYFGTATDNPELTNAAYVSILNDVQMFGQITAANSMKWVGRVLIISCVPYRSTDVDVQFLIGCYGARARGIYLHSGGSNCCACHAEGPPTERCALLSPNWFR